MVWVHMTKYLTNGGVSAVSGKHVIMHFLQALILMTRLRAGLQINFRYSVENPEWGITNNTGKIRGFASTLAKEVS